jgi:hypothetical protein
MRVLSGKKAGPGRAAEGGSHEGVVEAGSLFGHSIEARGLDEGMAHVAHVVPAVIVGQDEDYVGFLLRPENRSGVNQAYGEYGKSQ